MRADESAKPVELAHEPSFKLGVAEVRPASREVLVSGRREVLEPRVMQVLVALARRRGEVVSRDDLIAACWGGVVVGEDSINRCIAAIRRLADTTGAFSIETIVRVGYRLHVSGAETAPARPFWRGGRTWAWIWAALALVVTLSVAGLILRAKLTPATPATDIRVAVLPFDTLSPGQDVRYFADGLRDEMLGVLSKNQVQAVSRADTQALRAADNREAIARLGVGLLMDGTVQHAGDTLRVSVHVDDARAHVTLWSRTFEGPAADPEVLKAQVAGHVTDVTKWLLSDRYGLGANIDKATLAAYLEAGDELENKGGDRFIAILRQVVARAPRFSYGHSALASALIETAGSPAELEANRAESQAEARRALELDSRNGEGYLVLAAQTPLASWRDREALLLKGLAADPASPYLPSLYGTLLAELGRGNEALARQRQAAAAQPYWARAAARLVTRLVDSGRVDEARAVNRRAAQLWPDDPEVLAAQFHLALEAEPTSTALSLLDDARTRPAGTTAAVVRVWRTALRARDSKAMDARQAAARVVEDAVRSGALKCDDAIAPLVLAGDLDGAFALSEATYSEQRLRQPAGYGEDLSIYFAPSARPLRADPRFVPLAERLGLAAVWRGSGRWPDFCAEPGLPYDCRAAFAARPPHSGP